jgi:hypothetical protein
MDTEAVNRRHVLRRASVAAGGVAVAGLGLAVPASADENDVNGLTGSWMIEATEVTADGKQQPTTRAVASFAAGGVLMSHAIDPAGPTFVGTWESRGEDHFRGTLWTGYPGAGGPGEAGPTTRIRANGHFDGGRISGDFTITDFDGTGKDKTTHGQFSGRRIDPGEDPFG